MKVLLMYPDRNIDLKAPPRAGVDALVQDLGLIPVFEAMAQNEKHLRDVAEKVLPAILEDAAAVKHRQDILRDCIACDNPIREMYALCGETIELERKNYIGIHSRAPSTMLHRSVDVMEMFAGKLHQLRGLAEDHEHEFRSPGLQRFTRMLRGELSDDYLAEIRRHLKQLKFRNGVTMSAGLDPGNRGQDYVLRRSTQHGSWFSQLLNIDTGAYSYRIPDRDEGGARALAELQDRGLNLVADALAQSASHILGFFRTLRDELAFFVGCLNLHHELAVRGASTAFPVVADAGNLRLSATDLIDVGLLLSLGKEAVGNDLAADGKRLVVITGANRGGKSTFLRSIGLAHVMAQNGMFIGAEQATLSICGPILTHFKREEDATMSSGKFDEELRRMSGIVDALHPNALVLFNESFASTNEREGSAVARQIVEALLAHGVSVFFVTHQYELANGLAEQNRSDALFLRAEREDTGNRTFKLREAEPLRTSYGEDLYDKIFGSPIQADAPTADRIEAHPAETVV